MHLHMPLKSESEFQGIRNLSALGWRRISLQHLVSQLSVRHVGLMTQQKSPLRAQMNNINSLQVSEVLCKHISMHWKSHACQYKSTLTLCFSSFCPAGDCPACTSSTRAAWTNGWQPAESVQSVELTSKHSWTLTADAIQPPTLSVTPLWFLLSSTPACRTSLPLLGALPNVSRFHVTSPLFWLTLYWAKPG